MKLISAIVYFLASLDAISSNIKNNTSSVESSDNKYPEKLKYCEEAFNFFSEAQKNKKNKFKEGELTLSIAEKDLRLVSKKRELTILRNSAFSYVLAIWYKKMNSIKSPISSPIRVTLNFKRDALSHLKGIYSYNIGLTPKAEAYAKHGKYHIVIAEHSAYHTPTLVALMALENRLDNNVGIVKTICKEEKKEEAKEFCRAIKKAEVLSEIEENLIYNPSAELEKTWSKCLKD